MAHDPLTAPRQSRLALVVARIDVADEPHWLLRRHRKWCDWSLVGGHVEPDELDDWSRTAERETEEELEPLHVGVDLALHPLLDEITSWGPVHSRSAGGALTIYTVRWFVMKFLRDPMSCLERLAEDDVVLVPEQQLRELPGVSDVVTRLLELTAARHVRIPCAGRITTERLPVRTADAQCLTKRDGTASSRPV